MKMVDGTFDYRSDAYGGRDSTCRLRVYEMANKINVVILTELDENHGASVTNTIEAAAQEVSKEYDLKSENTIFIEHYDKRANESEERFDLVNLNWNLGRATTPHWRHIPKREVEALIGEKLP